MIQYGSEAVKKSLKQMTRDGPIFKPVISRAVLASMRTINHLPPVKRRMAASQQSFRDHEDCHAPLTRANIIWAPVPGVAARVAEADPAEAERAHDHLLPEGPQVVQYA